MNREKIPDSVKTVIFWDIDGTLLDLNGAGIRAFNAAARSFFGPGASLADIPWPGKTDRALARLFAEHYDAESVVVEQLIRKYLEFLEAEVRSGGPLVPGVEALLARLSADPAVVSGLLTGNLRYGAELKLAASGLMRHFRFGAFADDAEVRIDLAPVALRRLEEAGFPDPGPGGRVLVGDTVHDVECAHALGARMLGISPDPAIRLKLLRAGAHRVISDFTEVEALAGWILSEMPAC